MDGSASPKWALGYNPIPVNPLPESFVPFFPARDQTTAVASEANARPAQSWADSLAARKPATRQPAWCRVAVPAHPSTDRRGFIMKRVGLSTLRPVSKPQPATAPLDSVTEDLDATRYAARQKPNFYKPIVGDMELENTSYSTAETSNLVMQAKVDVANCYLGQDYSQLSDDLRLAQQPTYTKNIVPLKRRFTDYSAIDFEYASGGNRMLTYNDLEPILSKAVETGRTEIDFTTASIVDKGARLQNARRDPRIHLALSGAPDLSDIADVTEPHSILALEPNESKADAKSPTKREFSQSPSPTKANKGLFRRLSDTIVKLVPASSSRVEPSPTKTSTPSTPFKDSPNNSKTGTPATLPKSPLIAQSPPSQDQTSKSSTPASSRWKTKFAKDSPFSRWRPKRHSLPALTSPAPCSRPVAPTPSKWNAPEPSTPYHMFTPAAPSASRNESSLALVASLPESIKSQMSSVKLVMGDPMNIDFGPVSPSFNSTSWLNSPASVTEVERATNVRRRRSEPLLRNTLKAQSARRKSLSPQKVILEQDEGEIDPTPCATSLPGLVIQGVSAVENLPEITNQGEEVTMEETTTEPNYAQYVKALHDVNSATPTPRGRLPNGGQGDRDHGIYDIDMRQNPDIFGAKPPIGSLNPDVEKLARIAEDRCNGQANVVVTEEDGRLFVRFKLPGTYASLFPGTQGADESQFSISPSAISSSPRIRFNNATSVDNTEEREEFEDQPSFLYVEDRTLAVSDFGSSPVKKTALLGTPTLPSPTKMPQGSPSLMTNSEKNSSEISFPNITLGLGNTTIPGMESPSMNASHENSHTTTSLSELERTPSLEIPAPSLLEIASTPAEGNKALTSDEKPAVTTPDPSEPTATLDKTAATATLNVSFTPVNKGNARSKPSTPASVRSPQPASTPGETNDAAQDDRPAVGQDDDSPGREYMRDFIKRSRPKRLSTTETGSPIAPPQRQPLGDKSPNMETPQKVKRKYESQDSENESQAQKKSEPAPKKVRRMARSIPRKTAPDSQADEKDPLAVDADATTEVAVAEVADTQEEDEEAEDAPSARRSSRLRTNSTTTAKSSIPTPIKVGRGRRAAGALSSVRNEQQDLTYQTRMNTRRNKGDAEYPAQVIARCSEEAEEEISEQETEKKRTASRGGKNVGWKDPLEAFQEEKPKRGRGAPPKAKAKLESSRVMKPAPRAAASMQRQRSARVAASLGMAGNGTPAKRVTRSSARTEK